MVCKHSSLYEPQATWSNLTYRKFFAHFGGEHHIVERELHEKYGSLIRDGPNSLLFSSLSAFDAIYGFNKFLEKDDFYDFAREPRSQAGSVFSARTDAIHREHRRKVVGPAFSSSKIAAYEPVISKHVSNLLSRLKVEQEKSEDRPIINIAPYIHRYTFDTIIETIFGESISSSPYTDTREARDLLTALRNISKMAWGTALLPWFNWIMSTRPMIALTRRPTFDEEGNLISFAALTCRTREIVQTQPKATLKLNQTSILENFLQVPESDTKHMSRDEIGRECRNLTIAGPGSTAAALTAILYELGRHGHEWQDRIRLGLLFEDDTSASSSDLLAVIKESMRLHAPFSSAFPRSIAPGAESIIPELSKPLPLGTIVSSNPYVLGHSKEIWGGDAESWRPQRWLGTDSERKKQDEKFVVFSKGARGCLGKDLAMLMLVKAVASVLLKWKISVEGDLRGKCFLEMQYTDCEMKFESL